MLALQEGQTASIYLYRILSTKYKFTFLKFYEIREHKFTHCMKDILLMTLNFNFGRCLVKYHLEHCMHLNHASIFERKLMVIEAVENFM